MCPLPYTLLGFLVAVSVTFPLFMTARERRPSWCEGKGEPAPMPAADWLGVVVIAAAVAGLAAYILWR